MPRERAQPFHSFPLCIWGYQRGEAIPKRSLFTLSIKFLILIHVYSYTESRCFGFELRRDVVMGRGNFVDLVVAAPAVPYRRILWGETR